ACMFCSKTLRLRCISWFATPDQIVFWPTRPAAKDASRPDALSVLLNPPEPPFVVGIPLYGIGHGGEAHWRRTWWPGEHRTDYLERLQAKHVALYSRVAHSRDRYPVQVDDNLDFLLDRDTWLRASESMNAAMLVLVDDGAKPYVAKSALLELRAPARTSAGATLAFSKTIQPLRRYVGELWWPLICELTNQLED